MSDIPSFKGLVEISTKGTYNYSKLLVAIDPGETTGFAVFKGIDLIHHEQITSGGVVTRAGLEIYRLLLQHEPSMVVMEDYRVYKWRQKQHAWSELFTPRLIGAIELVCALQEIDVVKRMAQMPKQFCDDVKLKTWGMYVTGSPHARDAIRHGCYHIIFGHKEK